MARKEFGLFDPKTGEVIEHGFTAVVFPKRRNGFGERWLAMAQDAAMLFAKSDLKGDDFRVLMALIAYLDFENLLVINQAEMARELGMHRQHVQRSIKRIIALGALLEGPRIGTSRSYRLSPSFGWKGSSRNHHTALTSERQERMKAAGIRGVIEGGKSDDFDDPNQLALFD